MNRETGTFPDTFVVIDRGFTTTFTFSTNIYSQIYWCNTFTDILYTTMFANKKVDIVLQVMFDFASKERDRSGSSNNLPGICNLAFANCRLPLISCSQITSQATSRILCTTTDTLFVRRLLSNVPIWSWGRPVGISLGGGHMIQGLPGLLWYNTTLGNNKKM